MTLWLLVSVPLLAGAGLLVAGRRADRLAPVAAIVAAVGCLALASFAAYTRPVASASLLEGIAFGLAVDGLSAVMVLTVAAVLVAVLVFAAGDIGRQARFFGLMLLFAGAMLVTVTATTMASLLMAWEIMGATSYALIAYWWRDEHRVESGNIAFLTTRAADLGLYLAAGAMLAGGAGGLALADLPQLTPGWRDVAAAGIVLAALGKSAQLPFSFWLSRAMDGPSPVSALLHSATMVAAGAYLLLRLEPLLAATAWAAVLVAWVGAATALLLGAVAVVQRDLKQLLAASTCAQVGFMVLAAGVGGVTAGSAHLVAHAATKSLLFLCAGAWLTALGTKELTALRGAAQRYRVIGLSFAVGALALAGVPPLSIWVTKDAVLADALRDSLPLYLAGLAATVMSGLYAGRALWLVWTGDSTRDARPVPRALVWPLPVLAAAAAVLGVPLLGRAVAWELAVSGVVAALAVGVAMRLTQRGDRLASSTGVLADWLGLERFARRVVVVPTLAVAGWLARFDDHVVAGSVRASAAVGSATARVAGLRIDVSLDRAVAGVAENSRRLGRLARRPQTGQLHHYYAQAVVVLALLATLLIITGRG
ncbi:NADH:ubiquinone oxidoreductase subunit 5 (chain L)/Multisubunit Na+/H+ antiporter, MnhA subunit [Lentzea albidocapillata subsp. violacea]|uniref:NADH:ubiquinone oxidoreductase subunit 5 (Chain L)/Multisubunit Na+/H+ antiporter, MnhA subunit n=1 Tax=Lentzea albidocapillata subsp. violacea TaxID=128104 RepID=A0A1G9ZX78_9PSEU|nr:proton-conducting transporter membrane subunit [Lentzea albidocapillata]SDN26172.1 NADH:ubiquinone oxidoreductase subunit 5 (chain L)/Multisubunit Na+/H+ antiporter, MnhA subunit [Lentzea albidocapillata subsp. violacea]